VHKIRIAWLIIRKYFSRGTSYMYCFSGQDDPLVNVNPTVLVKRSENGWINSLENTVLCVGVNNHSGYLKEFLICAVLFFAHGHFSPIIIDSCKFLKVCRKKKSVVLLRKIFSKFGTPKTLTYGAQKLVLREN